MITVREGILYFVAWLQMTNIMETLHLNGDPLCIYFILFDDQASYRQYFWWCASAIYINLKYVVN